VHNALQGEIALDHPCFTVLYRTYGGRSPNTGLPLSLSQKHERKQMAYRHALKHESNGHDERLQLLLWRLWLSLSPN